MKKLMRLTGAMIGAFALVGTAACGANEEASTSNDHDGVMVTDSWTASSDPDQSMVATFANIMNHTDAEVVVTGASVDVAADVETHEMVADDDGGMMMQQKDGGFVVPAGGVLELAPGGDHLMMVGLTRELKVGEKLQITLELENGETAEFESVVKDHPGGDEEYHSGDMSHMGDDKKMNDKKMNKKMGGMKDMTPGKKKAKKGNG